jgi:hypothetical protein
LIRQNSKTENVKMTRDLRHNRALKILCSTYWSPSGWKKVYSTPPEELAFAKAAGVMFEPKCLTHDEAVAWALRSRAAVSKPQATNAFLASLTSRRLDWRSALGSFAVSLNLPAHRWSLSNRSQFWCPVCGSHDRGDLPQDLSILNFERLKWGGVRHTNPLYIGFDLEQFSLGAPAEPADDDLILMRHVLSAARSLRRDARLSDLVKALAGVIASNSSERRTLIGILGFCGILQDPSKPGFIEGFPDFSNREEVPWTKNDWPYPVQWWNGSCGVSEDAVGFWFPNL